MSNIFKVFGRSPIKPIEQHMHKSYTCAKQLLPLLDAVLKEDWEKAKHYQTEIDLLEREADHIKKELRLHLPTGLFLPVDRTDILELLKIQDRIANTAQDIAGLLIGRQMLIPKSIAPYITSCLSRSLEAAKQACKAINELDELLETGFRGNEVKIVDEMIHILDDIEHLCDDELKSVRNALFKIEKDLHPIDAMCLYQLLQWIGNLADEAQSVGGRLQILIAR
ncbi:MAG: TIGR00153 family protein [Gammaproteobacteria bacterium]|nr:TIGR00153 family protein [Gammaproteobacteria bacterium]